jgi:hypothetical protein
MVANDENVDKKFLMELFYNFELPLSINEFLEPIGKKDFINYNDFCLLFKSRKFTGISVLKKFEDELFPVTICKFNKMK